MRGFDRFTATSLALALGASGCSDDDSFADLGESAGRPNVGDETGSFEETGVGADEGSSQAIEIQLDALSYHLDWETPASEPGVDAAWEVENDLGYRVRVHEAWTTIYGMSLIPCELTADEVAAGEVLALISSAFTSRVAYAGHSGENDQSADYDRQVEDLTVPLAIDYGEVYFESTAYCQYHFVYGPPNAETEGLPEDADIVGKSIHVRGSWRGPGDEAWTEFTISASHANGKIIDFAEAEIGMLDERVPFRLVRDWRSAFDGIDFEAVSQWDLELDVLANLVASARLEIGEF